MSLARAPVCRVQARASAPAPRARPAAPALAAGLALALGASAAPALAQQNDKAVFGNPSEANIERVAAEKEKAKAMYKSQEAPKINAKVRSRVAAHSRRARPHAPLGAARGQTNRPR